MSTTVARKWPSVVSVKQPEPLILLAWVQSIARFCTDHKLNIFSETNLRVGFIILNSLVDFCTCEQYNFWGGEGQNRPIKGCYNTCYQKNKGMPCRGLENSQKLGLFSLVGLVIVFTQVKTSFIKFREAKSKQLIIYCVNIFRYSVKFPSRQPTTPFSITTPESFPSPRHSWSFWQKPQS